MAHSDEIRVQQLVAVKCEFHAEEAAFNPETSDHYRRVTLEDTYDQHAKLECMIKMAKEVDLAKAALNLAVDTRRAECIHHAIAKLNKAESDYAEAASM